jgi:type II secretion system protein N
MLSGGKLSVTFDDVSLYRFSGIAAEGVKLKTIPAQGEPLEIEVDELWLRLQLLPLALLNVSVSGGVGLGDGSVDAVVAKTGEGIEFEAEVDDLDFAKPPLLSKMTGVPVRGKLAGKLDGVIGLAPQRLPGGKKGPDQIAPDKSEAQASLTLRGLTLGPGSVKGFTIPAPISFGQLDMALDMRRGRARMASFKQTGGQVALDVSGGTTLRRTIRASSLDTCVKLKFTDEEYLRQHPKINTALQLAQVQLKKDGQGFLNLKHTGTLANPKRQRGLCRSGGRTPGRPGDRR